MKIITSIFFIAISNFLFGNFQVKDSIDLPPKVLREGNFNRGPNIYEILDEGFFYSANSNYLFNRFPNNPDTNSIDYPVYRWNTPNIQPVKNGGFIYQSQSQFPNSKYVCREAKNNQWCKEFGNKGEYGITHFKKFHSLPSEEFLLLGTLHESNYLFTPEARSDVWVLKVDRDGEVVWSKSYGMADKSLFNSLSSVQELENGNLLLVCRSRLDEHNTGDTYFFWMLEIDEESNEIRKIDIGKITLPYPNRGSFSDAKVYPQEDNGFIVLAQVELNYPEQNAVVMKLDSTGNIEWNFEIDGESPEDSFFDFQKLESGNLLFRATAKSNNGNFNSNGIDTTANLHVETTADGQILRAEKMRFEQAYNFPNGKRYVLKDSILQLQTFFGDLIWKKNIGTTRNPDAFWKTSFLGTSDGGVIISRQDYGFEADTGFVNTVHTGFKLSKKGNRVWEDSRLGGIGLYSTPYGGYISRWSYINGENYTRVTPDGDTTSMWWPYDNGGYTLFDKPTYCPPSDIFPDSISLCPNQILELNASTWHEEWPEKQKVDYLWSTGETSEGISINSTGDYFVEILVNDDCKIKEQFEIIENTNTNCFRSDTTVVELCYGESFEGNHYYKNQVLTETEFNFPTTVEKVLDIKVNPQIITDSDTIYICRDNNLEQNYSVLGNTFEQQAFFQSQNGCDSIHRNIYHVKYGYEYRIDATICRGDTFFFENRALTNGIIYRFSDLEDYEICRNVVVDLKLFPKNDEHINLMLQSGELFNNIPILSDTSFIEIYEDQNGCDSTITTNIIVEISSTNQLDKVLSEVKVFPNPVNDFMNIEFYLNSADNFSLNVIDALGRVIKPISTNEFFNTGKHKLIVDTSQLPSGIYFLKFDSNKKSMQKSFSK